MNFSEHYFKEETIKEFVNEVKMIVEQEMQTVEINPMFVSRLCNYLEKRFPNYGDFDVAVGNEIRQYMQGDNSYVKKVKQRIHDIITKAKSKFLRDVHNKVDKIKVQKKVAPKSSPINYDPLMNDEPTQGKTPSNVNL